MEMKSKTRKVGLKLSGVVPVTQPSALRHHREKAVPQRVGNAQPFAVVLPEGFERRSDHVADNKRGQVYIVQRLSDPSNKAAVAHRIEAISSEKSKALEFLQSIGVASAAGRLTERFGG